MKKLSEAPDVYLSISDLASRWKKSDWWVYTNHKELGVPCLKLGRQLRFPLDGIIKWEQDRI
jgi:hypothetical protein